MSCFCTGADQGFTNGADNGKREWSGSLLRGRGGVSEQILNGTSAQLGNTVLFTSVHAGKYRTEDKSRTDNRKKIKTQKKQTTQNTTWFSRFFRHSARKRGGLILQLSQAHRGHLLRGGLVWSPSGIHGLSAPCGSQGRSLWSWKLFVHFYAKEGPKGKDLSATTQLCLLFSRQQCGINCQVICVIHMLTPNISAGHENTSIHWALRSISP